ncbi:MAG: hypothetical protein R3C68_11100 [Myxococcota bacterium]
MADDAPKDEPTVFGKPVSQLTSDERIEALERGEMAMPTRREPHPHELFTLDRFEKFVMGEMTLAEFQGMTIDEAYAIAEHGYAFFEGGRYEDARVIFEGLSACNPYDAYFHNMIGAIYQQLDRREEALDRYTLAIVLDREHAPAFVNRAELLLERGNFEIATEDLKRVIELDPDAKTQAGMRARALMTAAAQGLIDGLKVGDQVSAGEPLTDKSNDDEPKA